MIDQFRELFVEFFSNENIRAFVTMGSAIFIAVGTKIVFGNINKQKGLLGNISGIAKDMVTVKSTVEDEKVILNLVLEREKEIEDKLTKVAEKEDIIVEMLKQFVMGTSIDIDKKLEVGELYDRFKKLDIKGDVKSEVDSLKQTKDEVISQVNKYKEDKITKLNAYKQALMGTGDEDDTGTDQKTDKA